MKEFFPVCVNSMFLLIIEFLKNLHKYLPKLNTFFENLEVRVLLSK